MKSLIVSASLLALCATAPAIAQSSNPESKMRSVGTISDYMQGGDIRTSRWIGYPIHNKAGKTIGDVNDFILTNDGKLRAVVAGVGGFLGMGEKDVLIPFSKMEVKAGEKKPELIAFLSKEELEAAPEFGITGSRLDDATAKAVKTGKENVSEAVDTAQDKTAEATEKMKDTASEVAEEAKEAGSEVSSEAKEAAGEATEAAGEASEETKDAAKSTYDAAKEAVNETVDAVTETTRDAYDDVKDAVTGK